MDAFYSSLAWLFTALSLGGLLGLTPRFRAKIYPENPNALLCAAAPVLFSLLAVACFCGLGLAALSVVAVGGLALIAIARSRRPISATATESVTNEAPLLVEIPKVEASDQVVKNLKR